MALEEDKESELSHRARDLYPEHGFSYVASSEQFMTTGRKISFCSACGKQINSYLGKTV
jgi:NADH pyrophosphatase NudC (nudix superfamily)